MDRTGNRRVFDVPLL